jgi:replicative DNA helicase
MGDRSKPIEAEQSVLGGVMLDNTAWGLVKARLTEDDFSEPQHRVVWKAFAELARTEQPIDEVTVTSLLRDRGALDKAGGSGFITELVERIPTAANIETYAAIVRQASCVRAIYRASKKAMQSLAEGDELDQVLATLQAATAAAEAREPDSFHDIADDFGAIMREMERRHEAGTAQASSESFIRTGFQQLDDKLIGFGQGQLIVVAAKSSVGKTSLALNFSSRQTLAGERVAFFSGEMKRLAIARRLFACTAPVNHHVLRAGLFGERDWPRAAAALQRLPRGAFLINDSADTIQQVCALATRVHAASVQQGKRISVVYVDYLQRLVSRKGGRNENREQQVAQAAVDLKNLARKLDCSVVVMSQLNKEGGARESDAIFHECDVFLELDRPGLEDGDPTEAFVRIKKQRDGDRGQIQLHYRGELFQFTEPTPGFGSEPRPSGARTAWMEKD